METINAWLCGTLLPLMLVAAGLTFGCRLRFFWIVHPLRTVRTLLNAHVGNDTSPFAALTLALAGTLGVGNIVGVATALTAGGPGALFWMLVGSVAAMGVKYAEVFLAVYHRRERQENGTIVRYGGTMYTIRDGLSSHLGKKNAARLGGIFAVLCILNALLTGNIVQVNAAVQCTPIAPTLFGILFAAAAVCVAVRGVRRVSSVTAILIPTLAGMYTLLSIGILFFYRAQLPAVFLNIWNNAWDWGAAAGGTLGLGIRRAIRFGITRGIFSNEAGCGTAPTAHAAANTRSPHHQGCFGIFEVFADTVLLCSITGLVILLYNNPSQLDGISLALAAYTQLSAAVFGAWIGNCTRIFLQICIVLFAFATLICQICYGLEAVAYLSSRRIARGIYLFSAAMCVMIGVHISAAVMWNLADFVIAVMTGINLCCLWMLRRFLPVPP